MYVDPNIRRALIPIRDKIVSTFSEANWIELGSGPIDLN